MAYKIFKLAPMQIVFALLTVACMVLIFCFSMEDADRSSETSGNITEIVVNAVVRDYDELPADEKLSIMAKADHIIRKSAHFSVYLLLGALAALTVDPRRLSRVKICGVIAFCFLYACSDELHQYFVPGRACMFTDVLIDTGGSCVGTLLSLLIILLIKRIHSRNEA